MHVHLSRVKLYWFRSIATTCYLAARAVIAIFRSVHELLWAVLFLAAFGLSDLSAFLAIGIPSGGMIAKVFSEIIDETDPAPRDALVRAGVGPFRAFLFAQLPLALPDLLSYALYRFECTIRASAVLGFFGIPTLGYYLSASFENLYYREVWTYLYGLFVLVLLTDTWSAAVRRRLPSL